jgi:hypothetical protein
MPNASERGRDRHSGRKVGLFLAGKRLFMEARVDQMSGGPGGETKGVDVPGGIEERIGRKGGVLF